jgi:hypothetical protein
MHRNDLGTWFTADLEVHRDGHVQAEFDYDSEPEWNFRIDPVAFVTDNEKFPRDFAHQPAWLRPQISEAGAIQ